ncbi:MAG: HNH endonuclease signature motif containing protein [Candidatus Competibacteraceae bacterium]|nr:HNH endonuclease signature motif containing protein [Candidatus Competibacteraceae bacterium]
MSRTRIPAALRRLVHHRAGGCCEYCQIPEQFSLLSHQIDHIIPEKHGGYTDSANLALACVLCNKHKGSDLASIDPLTGQITPLYNPRRQHWAEHFTLMNDGLLTSFTPAGRTTIQLLQLNRPERVEERKLLQMVLWKSVDAS